MSVFALGIWTVKEGREDDFVRAWLELGERVRRDVPERAATLLRDRQQPNRFISFSRRDSLVHLEDGRNRLAQQATESDLRQWTGAMMELVENLDRYTLDVVGEIE